MIDADQIIYLDNNATTRPDPAVVEEMVLYLEKLWGNPSSGYRFGKQVRAGGGKIGVDVDIGNFPNHIAKMSAPRLVGLDE